MFGNLARREAAYELRTAMWIPRTWYCSRSRHSRHVEYIYRGLMASESGHYTQLVWATTRKVGCGYTAYTKDTTYRRLYVCNYLTAGNLLNSPVYLAGSRPCSNCPATHPACNNGLCRPWTTSAGKRVRQLHLLYIHRGCRIISLYVPIVCLWMNKKKKNKGDVASCYTCSQRLTTSVSFGALLLLPAEDKEQDDFWWTGETQS
jgi:hypothetical protein